MVLKYSQIYFKYFQFNKYTELQYHDIENFVTVSKNDIAVLLHFGILQSPSGNLAQTLFLQALTLQVIRPSKNRGLAMRDSIQNY